MYQWGQFLESIIDRIQSGVILIDIDGRIADLNHYTLLVLQITKEAWVGRNLTELFPDIDLALFRQAVSEKVTIHTDDLRFKVNQTELILAAEVSPYIVLGQTVGTVLTFTNQTQVLEMRDHIIHAEKMAAIGSMAAGTVHEIRNPLTTIKGFLQLFEKDIRNLSGMGLVQRSFSDKCANVFPLLFKEIRKIEQILNDFILISQPQPLRYRVIRINEFLAQLTPKLQEMALLYDVNIAYELPNKNSKFLGDPEEVSSVLVNLVKNSIESLENTFDGKIYLAVTTTSEFLQFVVSDNGQGMAEDLLKIAMEPFITTKVDRPGLGLSICQQVVSRMGGTVQLSSEVGRGTTVEITIPSLQDDIVNLDEFRMNVKEATYL